MTQHSASATAGDMGQHDRSDPEPPDVRLPGPMGRCIRVANAWRSLARPTATDGSRAFEVRLVPPGRPDLAALAEAAFSLEYLQICTKDNLTAEQQRAHYAYAEPFCWWLLVIDQRGPMPIPAASMRFCWLSTAMWNRGLRPPCVRDMADEPWFADPEEVLTKTRRPNGEPLLDLVAARGVISLESVSVPEEYHDTWVVWIIYAAICRFTLFMGCAIWCVALDRLQGGAYWSLQQHFMHPFLPYFTGELERGSLAPGVYFANLQGDPAKIRVSENGASLGEVEPPNWTEQRWCDFFFWHDRMQTMAQLDAQLNAKFVEDLSIRRYARVFRRCFGDELKRRARFEDLQPLRDFAPQ